jgi:ankyrin repeat protein
VDAVRVLLEHGADTTAQDNDGSTPLHLASQEGHVEAARILLEHGAETTAQDNYG